jgi:hypothetical protein
MNRRRLHFGPEPSYILPAGYSITYDNVQFQARRKVTTKNNKGEFHIMALAFAAKDRVDGNLQLTGTNTTSPACSLPAETFLPIVSDVDNIKNYMAIILKRVAVRYLPSLHHLQRSVTKHVEHEYSTDMTKKSDTVNLGVLEGNPSKTPDTIAFWTT